jgi:hypothetical protein
MSQIRESASLKVEDLEKRANECDVASVSPGVRVAAGVLAHAWLKKIRAATPEAAQLAAAALGAGYVTGRATLGLSVSTGTKPTGGASALIDRVCQWDYEELCRAGGENLSVLRKRYSLLFGDAFSKWSPPRTSRRMAYGLFSAGLGLAVAEAELGNGRRESVVQHA